MIGNGDNRYILLDRDGVINHDSDDYIKSPAEWHAIAGSLEAIALLNQHGFKVVVISNQSGLARGYYSLDILNAIHAKMTQQLAEKGGHIEAIYFCPHAPTEQCRCRKPQPGLLKLFSQETHTPLRGLFFIGDSLSDMQAAQAVSAKPILVKTGKGLKTLIKNPDLSVPIFENLYDATHFILATR
jgi:D-glycero-D-manno-heptose 1,7-bisphosphate phosphatase